MARRKNDAYYTPATMTEELLSRVSLVSEVILEPCAGKGAISDILKRDNKVFTSDIDTSCDTDATADATDPKVMERFALFSDWAVTNPPFKDAFKILQNCLALKLKVAFLLRLTFLEPTYERGEFLKSNPPTKLIVLPRCSFTEDGKTDSVTCAWMIWDNDYEDSWIQVCTKTNTQ